MTQDHPDHAPPMTRLPLDFTAFHKQHRKTYVRWAERNLSSRADAEEAIDQAFEELALSWHSVLAHENPAAYAWRVMKNRTIDYARARRRRPALTDTLAFQTLALRDAADPIGELEDSLALAHAVDTLSERQRDVVHLRFYEQYSYAQIAVHMGITEPGARSLSRAARQKLRTALTEERQGPKP